MIHHITLGNTREQRKKKLGSLIRNGEISLGGYKKRIYGLLTCSSGKRMKVDNRVFFRNEEAAVEAGFRPCGNCLPEKYKLWKAGSKRAEPKQKIKSDQ